MVAESQRIHDRIRHVLEARPGLTQRGLAECMGLNPAAVNRMLYGRRNIMAEEIPIIEAYLGCKLDIHAKAAPENLPGRSARRGFSDTPQQAFAGPPSPMQGFAVYVASEDMSPRYFKGELVFVNSALPPEAGRDAVIEKKNGTVTVRRILRVDAEKIRLQQFNPAGEKDMPLRDIKAIHVVTGRG